MKSKKTTDSYEASYYIMYGANVTQIKKRRISKNQQDKYGFRDQWIISLKNIPFWAILGWNSGITIGNIQEFKKARLKLKKMI